jgi:hypothetical protein
MNVDIRRLGSTHVLYIRFVGLGAYNVKRVAWVEINCILDYKRQVGMASALHNDERFVGVFRYRGCIPVPIKGSAVAFFQNLKHKRL